MLAGGGREMEASAELQGLCGNLDSRRSSFPLFFEGHGFNDFSVPVSSETCATVPFQMSKWYDDLCSQYFMNKIDLLLFSIAHS